jgi:CHAT domain-containing protein/Tfp pilus assembly protein PilF
LSKAVLLPLLVVLGQTPAAIPTERPDPGGAEVARELLRKGEALWGRDELTQAKGVLDEALDLGQRLADPEIEATALRLLGRVFDSRGDGAQASAFLERALGLAQAAADERTEARILDDLAFGYWTRAEYPQAMGYVRRALDLQERHADLQGQAISLDLLGRVHVKQGEYERAQGLYERALGLRESTGDVPGQAEALGHLAQLHLDRQGYASALAHYQKAASLLEQAGDRAGQGRQEAAIGYVYAMQGALTEARAHYRRAVALAQETEDIAGLGSALSKMAGADLRRGRYEQALERYSRSLDIRRAVGDRREEAWTEARIAKVHRLDGRPDLALEHYHRALTLWQDMRDRRALGSYLWEVGGCYESQGDDDEALRQYRRALALGEEIRLPYVSLTLGSMGRIHARRGEVGLALEHGVRAVQWADASGNPEMRWRARHDLGAIQRVVGRPEEALASLLHSLAILEALRAEAAPGDEARASWMDDKEAVYAETLGLLAERGDAAEALEIAERARARGLLDLLAARLPANGTAPRLAAPLSALALREEAQRRRVTFVEYFVAPHRIFIWVVGPDGAVHAAEVDLTTPQLDRLIGEMRRALKADVAAREWDVEERAADEGTSRREDGAARAASGGLPEARPVLARLHEALIEPIARWLPDDPDQPVFLVPHRKLFLVSFGALLDRRGRYFIESHSLSYSPAISVFRHTAQIAPGASEPRRVMVVGNPSMPTIPGRARPLSGLPGAEAEARGVSALFPADEVTTLLGPRAAEDRVSELATRQTILHLATHGIVRDDEPFESLLALAPSGFGDPHRDGLWTASEVFDLDLHADLVTLSACSTGLGRITGDGVLGLSRAFLHAGARSLVVSLWRVADNVGRPQMEAFYRELRRNGGNKAVALRRAQMETIRALRSGRVKTAAGQLLPEEPVYWAPFVLVGEAK